ncbi:MAG: hypothetical protein RSD95_14800, partial [Clostridia bacterium]
PPNRLCHARNRPKTYRPRPCFPVIRLILKTSGCGTKLLSCHSPWRAAHLSRSITRVSGNAVYLSVKWGYCSDKSGKIALDLLSLLCCARSLS